MKNVCRKITNLCAIFVAVLMVAALATPERVVAAQQPGAGGAHPYSTNPQRTNPSIPNWSHNGVPYVQMLDNNTNCASSAFAPYGPMQLYPMGLQSQAMVWQNSWMQDFGGFAGANPWSWYEGSMALTPGAGAGAMIAPFQSCGANLRPGFGADWSGW